MARRYFNAVRVSRAFLLTSLLQGGDRGGRLYRGKMKRLLEHQSLRFTICLAFGFLLTSSPSRAQNSQEKPGSQDHQAIPISTPNPDTTEGIAPRNSAPPSGA